MWPPSQWPALNITCQGFSTHSHLKLAISSRCHKAWKNILRNSKDFIINLSSISHEIILLYLAPLWASSTIFCLVESGSGLPFTYTPPSWFTPLWPVHVFVFAFVLVFTFVFTFVLTFVLTFVSIFVFVFIHNKNLQTGLVQTDVAFACGILPTILLMRFFFKTLQHVQLIEGKCPNVISNPKPQWILNKRWTNPNFVQISLSDLIIWFFIYQSNSSEQMW